MSEKSEHLLELAMAAFPDLTDPERKVVEAAALGKEADFRSGDREKDDPAKAETWGDDRKVRAAVLRWLCVDAAARRLVDPKGLCVVGARVEGDLDLSFARISFPLGLFSSAIPGGISLQHARAASISLQGTHTGLISADGLTTHGSVFLRNGFHAKGEVRLLGARIRGNLECTGGTFENPSGDALSADRLEVNGGVFMTQEFHAKGEVRLLGARIRGNLSCRGGTFENPGGDALNLQGAEIGDILFLDKASCPAGSVRLAHAKARVLVDDEASWPAHGNLDLRGFVYEGIVGPTDSGRRLDWIARQYPKNRERGHYHPQPYEQLAAVLRGMGHEADSKKVCIAREQDRRRYGSMGRLAKAWSLFLGATLGHGYAIWHVGFIALFIVALGGGVFWWGHRAGLLSPTFSLPADAAAPSEKRLDEAFCPWVYSLDTFLPIVDLHQEGRWLPNHGGSDVVTTFCPDRYVCITWGDLLCVWFWFEIGAGWLLTTLALAGLTGLIRRD